MEGNEYKIDIFDVSFTSDEQCSRSFSPYTSFSLELPCKRRRIISTAGVSTTNTVSTVGSAETNMLAVRRQLEYEEMRAQCQKERRQNINYLRHLDEYAFSHRYKPKWAETSKEKIHSSPSTCDDQTVDLFLYYKQNILSTTIQSTTSASKAFKIQHMQKTALYLCLLLVEVKGKKKNGYKNDGIVYVNIESLTGSDNECIYELLNELYLCLSPLLWFTICLKKVEMDNPSELEENRVDTIFKELLAYQAQKKHNLHIRKKDVELYVKFTSHILINVFDLLRIFLSITVDNVDIFKTWLKRTEKNNKKHIHTFLKSMLDECLQYFDIIATKPLSYPTDENECDIDYLDLTLEYSPHTSHNRGDDKEKQHNKILLFKKNCHY
ncbi:hypothetical protein RFI_16148 [Reticulomyxa filosa]|uniref:Uncharacterized protein n=1 Tax=Reticulomyxa filosa TaxID=46433 RepID=X6N5N2_RETFI|nr:hypothetical protein RFI_16148 [Reticulomyxa filosa]|eukprot:ETO21054.1 hypothetical protein RFI_16148 [Reticulomyxa filosa]